MNENNYIEEIIVRYLLDEATAEELIALEQWINASSENKSYFFQLKNISDDCRSPIFSEKEKNTSWQKMYDRLKKKSAKAPAAEVRKLPKQVYVFLKYVAMIVALFSLGWLVNEYVQDKDDMYNTNGPVYNEIKVEKGGRGNALLLTDGTKVTLNAATTFRYPTHFSKTDRTVYLDGEARFEVSKETDKPFIIKLKNQDITVLGTTFIVDAYHDENYSIVTLLSGQISLESYNENGESMSHMFLKPNQQAVSDNLTGSVSIQNVSLSLAETWTEGKYKFKNEPLSSIVKRLEKYYDVNIHLESEKLKSTKYTGTFSLDQEIGDVLQIINDKKMFEIKQVGKEIFIINK